MQRNRNPVQAKRNRCNPREAAMKTFKADLHVHSSYSNKPTYWAMRKFNCPESYTSPRQLYQTALARGMDYVTITDHNAIGGALEIAHLPNTFISCRDYHPFSGKRLQGPSGGAAYLRGTVQGDHGVA
jgi:hypothetical protein